MENKIYKVWQINSYLKLILDSEDFIQNILVEGEIANFKHHSSGHLYFSLKDEKSTIKCVCFKTNAQKILFKPKDGQKVIINGSISIYERDGTYQIYVNAIHPKGIGEMKLALDELKEKLLKKGYFDERHKKPIPKFTKKIGVITAKTGAVIKDIIKVRDTRNENVEIYLYEALVQGKKSVPSITQGIKFFNKYFPVDVIILGRGGGSNEDLFYFNDEKIVTEIYKSKIPIITAIGHETDTTFADFTSDIRAATPSQAAEFAVQKLDELSREIHYYHQRLNKVLNYELNNLKHRLEIIDEKPLIKNPLHLVAIKNEELKNLEERFINILYNKYNEKVLKLENIKSKFILLNPINILNRGFSIIKQKEKFIYSKNDLINKEKITIIFKDGEVTGDFIKEEVGK